MRKKVGLVIIVIAYIQCAIALTYSGVLAAIAGMFNWLYFLLALLSSILVYVFGLWVKDGSEIFKPSREQDGG